MSREWLSNKGYNEGLRNVLALAQQVNGVSAAKDLTKYLEFEWHRDQTRENTEQSREEPLIHTSRTVETQSETDNLLNDWEVNHQIFARILKNSISLYHQLFPNSSKYVECEEYLDPQDPYMGKHLILNEVGENSKDQLLVVSVLEAFRKVALLSGFQKAYDALRKPGITRERMISDLVEICWDHGISSCAIWPGEPPQYDSKDILRKDIEISLEKLIDLEDSLLPLAQFSHFGGRAASSIEYIIRRSIWLRWDPGRTDFWAKHLVSVASARYRYKNPDATGPEIVQGIAEILEGFDMDHRSIPFLYRTVLSNIKYLGEKFSRTHPMRIDDDERFITDRQMEEYEQWMASYDNYPSDDRQDTYIYDPLKVHIQLINAGIPEELVAQLNNRDALGLLLQVSGFEAEQVLTRLDSMLGEGIMGDYQVETFLHKLIEELAGKTERYFNDRVDIALSDSLKGYGFVEIRQFVQTLPEELRVVLYHRLRYYITDGYDYENDKELLHRSIEPVEEFCDWIRISRSVYYRRLRKIADRLKKWQFDPRSTSDLSMYEDSKRLYNEVKNQP